MAKKLNKKNANRDGITLLFVISMVVLFLLMGTTFMLIANDQFKSARSRLSVVSYQIDSEGLLDRSFYDLVRGPLLTDVSSPLRGHSILADQYGYGLSASVFSYVDAGGTDEGTENIDGPFVTIFLSASPTPPTTAAGPQTIKAIRKPGVDLDLSMDPAYVDDVYAGRVLSITSGALQGYSSRIISNVLLEPTGDPTNNRLGIVLLSQGLNWSTLADNDEVIINGADFSGRGAGDLTSYGATFALLDVYNPDVVPPATGLGANSYQVNQSGLTFDPAGAAAGSINTDITGYLASDQSTNEPYDVPDHQNYWLGGFDSALTPNPIASFHRDRILNTQIPAGVPADIDAAAARAALLRQYSLRPIYVRDPMGQPDSALFDFPADAAPASTANFDFFESSLPPTYGNMDTDGDISANGTMNTGFAGSLNSVNHLDVDSDGDGINDSVWIDIGLPAQTDAQGRTFKPLVAYRVLDMDGRLNLNAAGSWADQEIRAAGSFVATDFRGAGYGMAEVSPSAFVSSYPVLLSSRYDTSAVDPIIGNTPGQERDETGKTLPRNQKLFGYPSGVYDDSDPDTTFAKLVDGSFSSGADLIGQLEIESAGLGTLPEFAIPVTPLTAVASEVSPYRTDFGLTGSPFDDLFMPEELEALLRSNDADAQRIPTRLLTPGGTDLVVAAKTNAVTTHSFETTLPATTGSLVKKLNKLLVDLGIPATATPALRTPVVNSLLSRHLRLGGKLDINRALGNGMDTNKDGVVDNDGTSTQVSAQHGTPTMDLDQDGMQATGDGFARQILAQDLYVTALLVCGPMPPPGFTVSTTTTLGGLSPAETAYRTMIAQWAVNMVDFRDADSIMSQFNFDPTPFDGAVWAPLPAAVVWGAERPELLISETFAYHDRRNSDLPVGGGSDPDWDSAQVPQSGAFFELLHPWGEVNGITRSTPPELGAGGVNLGQTSPAGDPVWRLSFKRARADATFARAVYFYEVDASRTSLVDGLAGGEYFFTTLDSATVGPGEIAVIGPSGNVGLRGGRYETTFGRLTSSTDTAAVTVPEIEMTRSIGLALGKGDADDQVIRRDGSGVPRPPVNAHVVVINSSATGVRSFSLSDPDGGYATGASSLFGALDGQLIVPALDRPLDATVTNASDNAAIWTNGVTDNFRIAYLQRLANPLLDHSLIPGPMHNPYLTIDTAGVDLLAFNGLTTDSSESRDDGAGGAVSVVDGGTFFKSVGRGESKIAPAAPDTTPARRNLFASEEGNQVDTAPGADDTPTGGGTHHFDFAFSETFGSLSSAYTTPAPTTPFGWLTWNNRPFSSGTEIANVPYLSSEWLCYFFNDGTIRGSGTAAIGDTNTEPTSVLAGDGITQYEVMAFFSNTDQNFKHLLRFGQNNEVTATFGALAGHPAGPTITAAVGTTNRMVNIFDYIEVPSKFQGSETFLGIDAAGDSVNGAVLGGFNVGFEAPFHGVPNFRAPGKININTMNDADIWTALLGFTPGASVLGYGGVTALRGSPAGSPSDFDGVFTSAEGAQFFSPGMTPRLPDAGGTIFQSSTVPVGEFDFASSSVNSMKDDLGSPYFKNEVRQRLGNMVTTRSSVFSIWITLGYFELDEYGRIGAEIGSDEGVQVRNRAFYMIDRSIPVAFEPGKDHNVDDTVLVRTIIE